MDLESISAELRPRRPWEAIDLGAGLFRRHLGPLLLFWSVSVLPLIVLLSVLLWSHFQILVIILWWLKPLYDRVPLYYLSRVLFGSPPTLRQFFRELPKLWTRRLWQALVVGRFSMVRSFVMPVGELEHLRGAAYRDRKSVLLRSGDGEAKWFHSICLTLEHLFTYAIILFVMTASPAVSPPDPLTYVTFLWEILMTGEIGLEPSAVIGVFSAWILALTLLENIYVAGGFGLYLNARTELEGWDVELSFRRLANRIRRVQASGIVPLIAILAAFLAVPSARAADPATDPPGQVIDRILDHDDFIIHKRTTRIPVSNGPNLGGFPGMFSFLGWVGIILFYGIIAGLIALAIWLIYKNRHYFIMQPRAAPEAAPAPSTRTILGMEIGADSLPDDIVVAARAAWQNGHKKEALSFLYRGSISWLVESARAPIRECDTESDCLRHARDTEDAVPKIGYLESLTREWIGAAYGQKDPPDESMERLCNDWPFRPGSAS